MDHTRLFFLSGMGLVCICLLTALVLFPATPLRSAASADQSLPLGKENWRTPTRLNAAERMQQLKRCVANAENIYLELRIRRVHFGAREDIERNNREGTEKNCNCLVEHLEDKSTHLQFEQAMTMGFGYPTGFSTQIFSLGDPERLTLLYPKVARFGITQKDFNEAGEETKAIITSLSSSCSG